MTTTDQLPVTPAAPTPESTPQATDPLSRVKDLDVPAEAKPEEAAAPEEKPTPDDAGAEPQEPKKAKGVQKRIDELTAAREDARRREEDAARDRDHWRELALKAQGVKPNQPDSAGLVEPREADYPSFDEYLKAREEYLVEKGRRVTRQEFEAKEKQEQAKRVAETMRDHARKARESFNERAEAVAEHYDEFAETIADMWGGKIPVIRDHDAVAEFIVEHAERGPELAYHLKSNPKVAEQIGKLPPLAQVRELTRLEASLPKPEARKVSKAPTPGTPVKATGGPVNDLSHLAETDMKAYAKQRAAEERARNS